MQLIGAAARTPGAVEAGEVVRVARAAPFDAFPPQGGCVVFSRATVLFTAAAALAPGLLASCAPGEDGDRVGADLVHELIVAPSQAAEAFAARRALRSRLQRGLCTLWRCAATRVTEAVVRRPSLLAALAGTVRTLCMRRGHRCVG